MHGGDQAGQLATHGQKQEPRLSLTLLTNLARLQKAAKDRRYWPKVYALMNRAELILREPHSAGALGVGLHEVYQAAEEPFRRASASNIVSKTESYTRTID
jgi:hypothetical protein